MFRGDLARLFTARALRLFGFGMISVVLVLHLAALGLDDAQAGLLLSLILAGDAALSLWIAMRADRAGRRLMLQLGALLMIAAGLAFGLGAPVWLVALAAILGTLSPSGNEVGAFLAIEQAGLSQIIEDRARTETFARYTLTGYIAAALGALFAGTASKLLSDRGTAPIHVYQLLMLLYALIGAAMFVIFRSVSAAIETTVMRSSARFGVHQSRGVVARLSALFALDAFGGGLIVQSWIAYWLVQRFNAQADAIGALFFGTNILAGLSVLAASRLAQRFGLIRTMVFSHLPSNVLLMLVALAPSFAWAAALLLIRACLSQMDVPTRQSYVMAVVAPDERSAAAGITGIARTVGAASAPILSGALMQMGALGVPFVASGALKIVYDLALYRNFRALKPPEERGKTA